MSDTRETIGAILNRLLGTDKTYPAHTPLLGADCLLDSFLALQLVSAVDQEFGIDLLEDDWTLECLDSLESMARCIEGKIKK